MAFAVAGQVITQSATDNDLSALLTLINGVASVARATAYTVGQIVRPPAANGFMYRCSVAGTTAAAAPAYGTVEGGSTVDGTATFIAHETMQAISSGTGLDTCRYISVGSWQLVVNGTLTMNSAAIELLSFGANAPDKPIVCNTGGTFTLGKRTTLNGVTRNEMSGGGIYSARTPVSHAFQGIHNNGGTINIYGRVWGNALPAYNQSGTLTIRDAIWSCRQRVVSTNVASMLFMAGGTIDVDGLTLEGEVSFVRAINGNVTQFRNVRTLQSRGIAQNETSTTPFIVNDYSPSGNALDSAFWQGAAQIRGLKHLNCAVGTNIYIAGTDAPNATWGWVECWRQVVVRALDPSNNPVSGAVLYARDTNNGNRGAVSGRTGAGVTAGQTVTARDTTYLATDGISLGTDRIYIQSTGVDGRTPQTEIFLGGVAIRSDAPCTQPGYDTGSSRLDRRGKTDVQGSRSNTDAFDLHLWAHNNLYTKISDFSMVGTGVATPTAQMLLDANVTKTSAQVAAMTNVATLDDLYDAVKSWKCQNVQARLEYPTIGSLPLIVSGQTLDFGSRPIIIDANAAAVLAINTATNVVTIKATVLAAGAKFTRFATTGTVTFANGSSVSCIYTSSAGTSAQLTLTGLTAGSSILITDGSNAVIDYVAASGTSYTLNIPPGASGTWTYRVARYGYQTTSGTFAPGSGGLFGAAITLIPDTFVVDTQSNVAAYTDLNTAQRIYDYSSLYGTTQAGMLAGAVMSRGFGTLTIPAGLTLDPAAGSLFAVAAGAVTVKCSGLAETVTLISTGPITGSATLGDNVRIRASNLDSEIITANVSSVTLYPDAASQASGASPGPTFASMYRYKFGETVDGVILGGTEYARVTVSGIVLQMTFVVSQGSTTIDLGINGQLAAINARLPIINRNVIAASQFVPAAETI